MAHKTAYVVNQGCRKNMQIGELFKQYFSANNVKLVDSISEAELILVNTCGFDQGAEDRSIAAIQEVYTQKRPESEVIVAGCLPSINQDRVTKIHSGPMISQRSYRTIEQYVLPENVSIDALPFPNVIVIPTVLERAKALYARTRSLPRVTKYLLERARDYTLGLHHWSTGFYDKKTWVIKISDGCLNHCTFCAIPSAVGKLHSRSIDDIVEEFHQGLSNGFRKFALITDDAGAYGRDISTSIPTLLETLLTTEGNYRLSIGNLNPRWFIREYHELEPFLVDERVSEVCLPIQSGNNRILNLMGRLHTIEPFVTYVKDLRRNSSKLRINTQVIVGFPTETEEEFQDTCDLLTGLRFDLVDAFKYADRPGTLGARFEPKVPEEDKNVRYNILQKQLRRIALGKRLLGRR